MSNNNYSNKITEVENFTTLIVERNFLISRATLCRMRQNGSGPPYLTLPGGKVLYPRDQFYKWMDSRTVRSSAELPAQIRGNRYMHLAQAREKALQKKKALVLSEINNASAEAAVEIATTLST